VYRGVLALLLLALVGRAAEAQIYTRTNRNGVVEATNVPESTDYRLTYPGKGTLIHSRSFRGGRYSGEYDSHILAAASTFDVPTDLVRSVITVESEFDRLAVSSKGAMGLMQLMPATARRFGVSDAFDARQNIFAGTQYLRVLLDMFQGEISLVLAAYNAGENAVLRFKGIPPYKETRNYVAKIQGLLSGLRPLSFAPRRSLAAATTRANTRTAPARPATYYKYRDDRGVLHIGQTPPPEGVTYSLIRAVDR
jgi:soluble lytic murein transglycosylase-like protein